MKQLFNAGDRVVRRLCGRLSAGTIEKNTKVAATVRFDDGHEDRVRLEQLRLETAEDVTQLAYLASVRAWKDQQPRTTIAILQMSNYSDEPYGARVVIARTPDQMQDAARELLEIAEWFQRRPVHPDAPRHPQEDECLVSQTTEGP